MLLFGHMGIGSKLASPWARSLPVGAVLLGTLVPDLIDKPLYYGLQLATGMHGADLGLVSSTRTFGHTALLLVAVTLFAVFRRSRFVAAIAIGMATHLFLDNLSDTLAAYFGPRSLDDGTTRERSALVALLYPFYLPRFSPAPFKDLAGHVWHALNALNIGSELLGAAILGWDYWKNRHESEIIQLLQIRRHLRRKRRHRRHQVE
jgi:hypothetical protein